MLKWLIAVFVIASSACYSQELTYFDFNPYDKTQYPKETLRNCRPITWSKMLGASRYTRTEIFCDDPRGRLMRIGNPANLPRDYLAPSQMASNYKDPRTISPDEWLGRSPVDQIYGTTLFNLDKANFGEAFEYANSSDPQRRSVRDVIWGHVSKAVFKNKSDQNPVYAFPFCLSGDCSDPDTTANNLGIFVQAQYYDGSPAATLYVVMSAPFGIRYCRIAFGHYNLPVCYNQSGDHLNVVSSDFMEGSAAALSQYDRLATKYESTHPAEPGSLKWLADHTRCDPVLVKKTYSNGSSEIGSSWSCDYVP